MSALPTPPHKLLTPPLQNLQIVLTPLQHCLCSIELVQPLNLLLMRTVKSRGTRIVQSSNSSFVHFDQIFVLPNNALVLGHSDVESR